jgi:hypothetical protein
VAKEMTSDDVRDLMDKIEAMAVADASHRDVMLEIAKAVGLIEQ